MTLLITESITTKHGSYLQATCGKVSGLVAVHDHGIQVVCQNASNKAWGKFGNLFPTADLAMAHYKRGEMKAIIQAALDYAATGKAIV